MKYKITFSFLLVAFHLSYGQTIFSNEITDTDPSAFNPYTNGQYVDPNITVSGIGRGSNVTAAPAAHSVNSYSAINWSVLFHPDDYFEFVLTPNAGYAIDFLNFIYTGRTSGFSEPPPTNIIIKSSLDGFTSNIGAPTLTGYNIIDLSGPEYQDVSTSIIFRVYAWGGYPLGIFGIEDFEFNGSVDPIPCYGAAITTWDGTTWNNGIPDISTLAVINADYDTNVGGNQSSFSACNLTVNTGNTLTIANDNYIEVENDITVDGTIIVNPKGAVVQNNDEGAVIENGSIQVVKETAMLNEWYEYTYWSSPVLGETIGGGLFEAQPDRRFSFNASNFVDSYYETNNNGTLVYGPGIDDIDDNGDDWELVNNSDIMMPGVGYAATHSQAFFFFPAKYQYIFEGPFNTGDIYTPVVRNDTETNDNNWNLIGNPYPSAINVDDFFNANVYTINASGMLDGTIYLWSQNTPPSSEANGNENLNFAQSDYATINGTGETAGGDGETPNRYIPSGQGFFVTFSDEQAVSSGNVVFNNSMRVTSGNDQFFRTSNKNNKLWLNLTSDNGVFNQILIGYVNGATNDNDGTYFDAKKNLSANTSATLYSIIENDSKKFVIQGRNPNSLNKDEAIKIGYKTSIDVPTIYTLSIPKLEGNFLNNNAIYIKDNLLNKLHNLKDSDYTFTSEVGEFNDRFEIVFSEDALSLNDNVDDEKALSIIEHSNGDVQFKMSGYNTMSAIQIIDLQGRILYHFKTDSSDQTFKLSSLSRAPYIAKVTLANGYVILKKAVKRY